MESFWLVHDALVQWLSHGLVEASWWQVLVYVLAWRKVGKVPPLATITGAVVYNDGPVRVASEELTDERAMDVWGKLREIGTEDPSLVPSPSEGECGFCDIADCRYRNEIAPPAQAESEDF
jgi:hypothetical protein